MYDPRRPQAERRLQHSFIKSSIFNGLIAALIVAAFAAEGETTIRDIGVEHVVSRSVRDSAALFAATEDSGAGAQLPPISTTILCYHA